MPHRRYRFLTLLPVLLLASRADATTRRVPSQFPTIQAGIDASAFGDTVLVAPGTYTGSGNRDIEFRGQDIVLRSEAGAAATVLNAGGGNPPANYRVFWLHLGETSATRIDGFTITGGRAYVDRFGGGILCDPASPTIANCIISQNWAGQGTPYKQSDGQFACGAGGALYISATPTPMMITGCVIRENGAECASSAVQISNATVAFERCEIVQNRDYSIFLGNRANCSFTECTIAHTAGFDGMGQGVHVGLADTVDVDRCVIWGNCAGIELNATAVVRVTCSVIDSSSVFGAEQIEYVGTNIFADPMFCDPRGCPLPPLGDIGDYRVHSASPCLPENNPCGVLIGALGLCAATSVLPGFDAPGTAIWASPNPFSTSTSLSLGSALDRDATLSVFDVAGRRVREFRMTRAAAPVTWDGTDENGQNVAAGTYLLRLEGRQSIAGRVTIVR